MAGGAFSIVWRPRLVLDFLIVHDSFGILLTSISVEHTAAETNQEDRLWRP